MAEPTRGTILLRSISSVGGGGGATYIDVDATAGWSEIYLAACWEESSNTEREITAWQDDSGSPQSAVLVGHAAYSNGSSWAGVDVWRVVAPAAVSSRWTPTWSGSRPDQTVRIYALRVTGGQFHAWSSAGGVVSAIGASLETEDDDCLLVDFGLAATVTANPSATGGQTVIDTTQNGSGSSGNDPFCSAKSAGTAGSGKTISWSFGGSALSSQLLIAIAPAAGDTASAEFAAEALFGASPTAVHSASLAFSAHARVGIGEQFPVGIAIVPRVGRPAPMDIAQGASDVGASWRGFWDRLALFALPGRSSYVDSGDYPGTVWVWTRSGPRAVTNPRSRPIVVTPDGEAWQTARQTSPSSTYRAIAIPTDGLMTRGGEVASLTLAEKVGSSWSTSTSEVGSMMAHSTEVSADDYLLQEHGSTAKIRARMAATSGTHYATPAGLSDSDVYGGPRPFLLSYRARRLHYWWRSGYAQSPGTFDRPTGAQAEWIGLGSYPPPGITSVDLGSCDFRYWLHAVWDRALTDGEADRLRMDPWGFLRRTTTVFAMPGVPDTPSYVDASVGFSAAADAAAAPSVLRGGSLELDAAGVYAGSPIAVRAGSLGLAGVGAFAAVPARTVAVSAGFVGAAAVGLVPRARRHGSAGWSGTAGLDLVPSRVSAASAEFLGASALEATPAAILAGRLTGTAAAALGLTPAAVMGGSAGWTGAAIFGAAPFEDGVVNASIGFAGSAAVALSPSAVRASGMGFVGAAALNLVARRILAGGFASGGEAQLGLTPRAVRATALDLLVSAHFGASPSDDTHIDASIGFGAAAAWNAIPRVIRDGRIDLLAVGALIVRGSAIVSVGVGYSASTTFSATPARGYELRDLRVSLGRSPLYQTQLNRAPAFGVRRTT